VQWIFAAPQEVTEQLEFERQIYRALLDIEARAFTESATSTQLNSSLFIFLSLSLLFINKIQNYMRPCCHLPPS
jgi:hypothetical protein